MQNSLHNSQNIFYDAKFINYIINQSYFNIKHINYYKTAVNNNKNKNKNKNNKKKYKKYSNNRIYGSFCSLYFEIEIIDEQLITELLNCCLIQNLLFKILIKKIILHI